MKLTNWIELKVFTGLFSRATFAGTATLVGALTCAFLVTSCSSVNTYTQLKPDDHILLREGVLLRHSDYHVPPGQAYHLELGRYESKLGFTAFERGFESANSTVYQNTLVFGSSGQGVRSIYTNLNRERWRFDVSGGVVSELSIERNSVYFIGGDGFLYSLNVENGRMNWKYDLHNPVASKPTVSQGRVFVTTSDDTVYAFDASTGKWLWHYRRRTSPTATVHGASSPLVDGQEVMSGLSDGYLVSLNINDGQLIWEKSLNKNTKFADVDAHPVLDSGVLYVPSYDGALYALKREKGDVIWRLDAGGTKQIVIDGDQLFFPSTDGTVRCIEKATSREIWKFVMDGGTPTQLILTEKYVFFGSSHQYLYGLDRKTGKAVYRFDTGYDSGFYGTPAYDAQLKKMFILSSGGNLLTFKVRDIAKKEDLFSSGPTRSLPHSIHVR